MARIHSKAIAEHIRDVSFADMGEAQPTGVGAQYIQVGALEHYAGASLPLNYLPMVLIKPLTARYEEGSAGLLTIMEIVMTRIVYVQAYAESDTSTVAAQKATAAAILVEALWSDWNFPDLSLSTEQIESSFVDTVEYEPQEDLFAYSLNQQMFALAINHETVMKVNRRA